MDTKLIAKIKANYSAERNREAYEMFTLQLEESLAITDFVFDEDDSLKGIYSELSKEELKKLLCKLVDNHYIRYRE